MTALIAVPIACAVMYGTYALACLIAGHEHIPTPSGRCLACGLDATETS